MIHRADDHAHEHRQGEQRADGDHCRRGGLLRRAAEFACDEQADAAAHGGLGDREEAGLDGRGGLCCRVGQNGATDLKADFRDLPIASNSADLVVLPHVLEFSDNPHQILREVARVLLPEAQVAIACFNPWSLWGFRRAFGSKAHYPWHGRFIHLPRLKDWCALLGLEITAGRMGCYVPPCSTEKWLGRFSFMEVAGDRWWPVAGSVYFLQAVKRVRGLRLIMPKWSERLASSKNLAPAPKKVARPEEALTARNGVIIDQ